MIFERNDREAALDRSNGDKPVDLGFVEKPADQTNTFTFVGVELAKNCGVGVLGRELEPLRHDRNLIDQIEGGTIIFSEADQAPGTRAVRTSTASSATA